MSASSDYKTSKEAFVSGMSGSTIGHVNMVFLVALSSIVLHSALRTRLPPSRFTLLTEFITLVIPLLLSVTFAANAPGWLNLVLLVATAGVLVGIPRRECGNVLPVGYGIGNDESSDGRAGGEEDIRGMGREGGGLNITHIPLLPALTTYRAHMLILTAICILAVDFPIFPRSLAKCETFGVSLMDLGVGSFVFSQGVVSALPIIKNPTYLTSPFLPKLSLVLRKSLPLLILGFLRTVSVKGTEYPEHETEYGTHWNFFITLGVLPTLQVFLHPVIVQMPISLIGVIVALSHQIALSSGGLTSYVLNAPRSNVVSANKEGLVSLTGYLAIHILGVSIGTLILPPSPSYFRRQQDALRRSRLRELSSSNTAPISPSASTTSSNYNYNAHNGSPSAAFEPSASTASGVALSPTRERVQGGLEREYQSLPRSPTISRRSSFERPGSSNKEQVQPDVNSSPRTHLSPYPTSPSTSQFNSTHTPNGTANAHPDGGLTGHGKPSVNPDIGTRPNAMVKRENDRTAVELCSYAVLWWVSLGAEKLFDVGGGISRRLVNLQYITYVIAFNTTFILGYLLLDLIFFPSPMSKTLYSPMSGLKVSPPPMVPDPTMPGSPGMGSRGMDGRGTNAGIGGAAATAGIVGGAPKLLDAINRNGLVLFLLANVTTGLINLAIPTMYVRDVWAMVILTLYAFGICAVAWACRGRKLWRF